MIQKDQNTTNNNIPSWYVLRAKTISEVVKKFPRFKIEGFLAMFQKGMQSSSVIKPSGNYFTFSGTIEVYIQHHSPSELDKRIRDILSITQIGQLKADGYGKLQWLDGNHCDRPPKRWNKPKYRIRKELSWQLPSHVKELIRYGMLHDLVANKNHESKIYIDIPVSDAYKAFLSDHHKNASKSELISAFQLYDREAASLTRRHKDPRFNRYNWKWVSKTYRDPDSHLDLHQLSVEIEQVVNNVKKLYAYVYDSKELGYLVESMNFGHSSLREHLLVIANLIMTQHFSDTKRFDNLKNEIIPSLSD